MGRRRCRGFGRLGLLLAASFVAFGAPAAEGVNARHSVVVSEDPVGWTPHVLGRPDEQVMAILQIGDRVYVGGKFRRVQEAGSDRILRRRYLFAFNANTGRVSRTFRPRLDERVLAIDAGPEERSILIGGTFDTVNGVARDNVAKLDAETGELSEGFTANVNAQVRDLVVRGDRVYIGGDFTSVQGERRLGLAALDPSTGAVDPSLDIPFELPRRGERAEVKAIDVTPDGSNLVAVGNFQRVGGLDRTELAVLDLRTRPASVANWQTDRWKAQCILSEDSYIADVDISPNGKYFVTVSIGFHHEGSLCDTAARWELDQRGSGLEPTWVDYTGGDSLISVAVTGAAVYVGGHQRWMNNSSVGEAGPGAVERQGIAALDPANGLPFSWNPGRDRGHGVFVEYSTNEGLFLGSDTDTLAGEYHSKLGFFPVAGGTAIPPAKPGRLPADLFRIRYDDGVLAGRFFDGSTFGRRTQAAGGVDWSHARGAFMLSGRLYTGWDDGSLYRRSFDGTNAGPAVDLNADHFNTARITGMFFHRGRIYYTERKDPVLHYRYFTPESGIVGVDVFDAAESRAGVNFRRIRGMALIEGRLYFSVEQPGTAHDGNLYRVEFSGGRPASRTRELVSGPDAGDGLDWKSRGMFLLAP